MNIRFTSTLTAEDENAVAPSVMKALASILELLPIAYTIRIDTVDGRVFQEHGAKNVAHRVDVFQGTSAAATFES